MPYQAREKPSAGQRWRSADQALFISPSANLRPWHAGMQTDHPRVGSRV